MLLEMQRKHINYKLPKTKAVHLLAQANHVSQGGKGSIFCWKKLMIPSLPLFSDII